MLQVKRSPKRRGNALSFFVIQLVVIVYTLAGVAAKFASNFPTLSWGFIFCYGAEICILGVYAILWQQIIKRADLSVAYANRSVALLWSMLWAALFFQEKITVQNILGVVLVIAGTILINGERHE